MSSITSHELPPLRVARAEPILLPLVDGRVLAAGGWVIDPNAGYQRRAISAVEVLSKNRKRWDQADELIDKAGRLLMVNGLQWDSQRKKWWAIDTLPEIPTAGTLVSSKGLKVQVGGADWKGGEPYGRRETEHNRIQVGARKLRLVLQNGRIGAVLTSLADGRILVTGGYETHIDFSWETVKTSVAEIEIIDLDKRAVSLVGKMARARHHHGAALLPDGSVIVAGGRHDEGREEGHVEVVLASMSITRST